MIQAHDPMSFETWIEEYEDTLLDLWMHLQTEADRSGIMIFDQYRISFPVFCQLAYDHSSIPEQWTVAPVDVPAHANDDVHGPMDPWP